MCGKPGAETTRDVLDQRRVGDDQPLTSPFVGGRLIAPPELLELDGFYVCFQCDPSTRLD
jgi:hypothetical protein